MNRKFLLVLLAAAALPIVLRFAWFFPGFSLPRSIATPDYGSLKMPAAPVSTPAALKAQQTGGVIVVDSAHSNVFRLDEIQILSEALTERGARLDVNSDATTLSTDLSSARAYVVISPASSFSDANIRLVSEFVRRGGRLVVFTDATRGLVTYDSQGNPLGTDSDANFANPLLGPFGITVNADYLYNLVANDGNFRNVFLQAKAGSSLTRGVQKAVFYGTHSLETETGSAVLVGDSRTFSSQTDATPGNDPNKSWAASALSRDGNVLAFGDFSFLLPPYDTVADNAPLITNLADFLVGGKQQTVLADYPYVFRSATADVLPTSNVQMTAGMIAALSKLQTGLLTSGTDMRIVREAPPGGDLIVLGTFSPSDDLAAYVTPFGITLDALNEFVELQQFGKLGRSGNGVLLFSPGEKGNILVLLAESADDLATLLDTIGSGDLAGCVLQGNVGACSIGPGATISQGSPTPEGTVSPQPGG